MKKSMVFRIFTGYLVLVLIAFIIGAVLFSNLLYSFYIEQLNSRLMSIAFTLKPQVDDMFCRECREAGDDEDLRTRFKSIADTLGMRISLIDREGKVLFDSETDHRLMDNHINRAEITSSKDSAFGYAVRHSTTLGQKMLYHAVALRNRGEVEGFIRISVPIGYIYGNIKKWIYKLGVFGFFIIISSLVTGYYLSRGISRKLSDLVAFFDNAAKGDMDTRFISKENNELYPLHLSVNNMLDTIKGRYAGMSTEERMLPAIDYMPGPAVFIDRDNKIARVNYAFGRVFEGDYENRMYWEYFRDSNLNSAVEKAQTAEETSLSRIIHGSRVYECRAFFIEDTGWTLLAFNDITEQKAFEKQKREFFTNVSHELKTPLTAIKGFAETLDDETEGMHKSYTAIMLRHIDRLIDIIRDMSKFSGMEDGKIRAGFSDVDMGEVLENVILLFEQTLKQKGLGLHIDKSSGSLTVRGDRIKLEQMLINLIDNAVKFTASGSIRITLEPCREKRLFIRICDTGIGISKEDIHRIFDPFFVADKSRSRKMGGSGLGLSIVKQIINLHGGTIDTESQPDKGTVFNIMLPCGGKELT